MDMIGLGFERPILTFPRFPLSGSGPYVFARIAAVLQRSVHLFEDDLAVIFYNAENPEESVALEATHFTLET